MQQLLPLEVLNMHYWTIKDEQYFLLNEQASIYVTGSWRDVGSKISFKNFYPRAEAVGP